MTTPQMSFQMFPNQVQEAPMTTPNNVIPQAPQVPSNLREYTCRDRMCTERPEGPVKIVGAGTLAVHLSERHARLAYKQYIQQTLKRMFEVYMPEDQACQQQFVDDLNLIDRKALTKEGFEAFVRNRDVFEQAYRDIRGWTEQDNQQPVEMTNGVF